MPGAAITVTFDDAEVRRALRRLIAAGRDMTPAMRDIGEHLLNTTRERFVDQKAPDGKPWAPLSARGRKPGRERDAPHKGPLLPSLAGAVPLASPLPRGGEGEDLAGRYPSSESSMGRSGRAPHSAQEPS